MKILVTGANGQLGRCIRLLAPDSGHSFVFTDVVEAEGLQTQMLDITDPEAVRAMVAAEGIEAVVNCAAYTNVDAAEENYELADLLNAKAPENLAIAMGEVGDSSCSIKLIPYILHLFFNFVLILCIGMFTKF